MHSRRVANMHYYYYYFFLHEFASITQLAIRDVENSMGTRSPGGWLSWQEVHIRCALWWWASIEHASALLQYQRSLSLCVCVCYATPRERAAHQSVLRIVELWNVAMHALLQKWRHVPNAVWWKLVGLTMDRKLADARNGVWGHRLSAIDVP